MATYQSVQTTAYANVSTVVVTKPTGLAVGDLMVAALVYQDTSVSSSFTVPSGWTSRVALNNTSTSYDCTLAIMTKTADSADVAASNFSFTHGGVGGWVAGSIARVTSWGFIDAVASNGSGAVTTSWATGITPTRANTLIMFYTMVADNSALTTTFSSQAIATDNPSWTERFDFGFGSGVGGGFALATASRTQTSAFGNASFSHTGGSPESGASAVVVIVPQVDGSITQETKVNGYALSPIPKTELDAIVEDPTIVAYADTQWTNPDKPSTTWTNTPK